MTLNKKTAQDSPYRIILVSGPEQIIRLKKHFQKIEKLIVPKKKKNDKTYIKPQKKTQWSEKATLSEPNKLNFKTQQPDGNEKY